MLYVNILGQLVAGGLTTKNIAERLESTSSVDVVSSHLKEMARSDLVVRLRAGGKNRWWPNKARVSELATTLRQIAEMLPDDPEKDLILRARIQILEGQIAGVLGHPQRVEILKSIAKAPGTATEVLRRLPADIPRNKFSFSIKQLSKYGLIISDRIFIHTQFGGYYAGRYKITPLGRQNLEKICCGHGVEK